MVEAMMTYRYISSTIMFWFNSYLDSINAESFNLFPSLNEKKVKLFTLARSSYLVRFACQQPSRAL